jgi:hypothetical protein
MGERSVESGSIESGWMVVSLADESMVEELLVRLRTMGIEPAGVSVVRVETDRVSRSGPLVVDAGSKWEPPTDRLPGSQNRLQDRIIERSAIAPPERSPGRQFRNMVIAFLVGIGLLLFGIPRIDTVRGLLFFGLMLTAHNLPRADRPTSADSVPISNASAQACSVLVSLKIDRQWVENAEHVARECGAELVTVECPKK